MICFLSQKISFAYSRISCKSNTTDSFLYLTSFIWHNLKCSKLLCLLGFPGGSDSKESAHNAGELGSTPGSGRSPGEGNGNPLWYSCLENPMDREAWRLRSMVGYSLQGCKESDTTDFTFSFFLFLDGEVGFMRMCCPLWGLAW